MFNVEKYIEEVQKQIAQFQEYLELFDNHANQIDQDKLNKALAHFSNVNFRLNSEYQRYKSNAKNLEADFQEWYDEKFVKTKEKMMEGKTQSFKLSQSEIEIQLRYENKEEHRKFYDLTTEAKMKVDFMERLMKQWSEHGYNLKVLSDNIRTEMRTIGGNDREAAREETTYRRKIMD